MSGSLIFLDTHVLLWLYEGRHEAMSARAREMIQDADEILCSPMSHIEIQYLHEIGRFRDPPVEVVGSLGADLGLRVDDAPFFAVAREAGRHAWTRDPFDRLIVAQADLNTAPLLTKDAAIHAAYSRAVW